MELFIEQINSFMNAHPLLVVAIILWSLAWKGFALWKGARLSHKAWFIVLLITNTCGILDIIYIYFIANKYEVVEEESIA